MAALRLMFSRMVRFLSRLASGPILRTSVKRTDSRLHLGQLLLFEEGQPQVLEDQRGQFVHRDVGLVVVDARLVARLAALATCRGCGSARHNIADFALAIALTGYAAGGRDHSGSDTPRASESAP